MLSAIGVLAEATGMPSVKVLRPGMFKFRSVHDLDLRGLIETHFE
jgi:hypothetical protein